MPGLKCYVCNSPSLFFVVICLVIPSFFINSSSLAMDGQKMNTPACVAHRGYSSKYLENSKKAMIAALKEGVKGLEVDVHHTEDGVGIIHHDRAPKRTMRSKGNGNCRLDTPFKEQTFEELTKLCELKNSENIMTLEEVLYLLKDTSFKLFVELKDPPSEKTLNLLDLYYKNNVVMSFNSEYLQTVAQYVSDPSALPLIYLQVIAGNWPNEFDGVGASIFRKNQVQNLKNNNKISAVWTVNKVEEMEKYLKFGADYIITNNVRLCKKTVESFKNSSLN